MVQRRSLETRKKRIILDLQNIWEAPIIYADVQD